MKILDQNCQTFMICVNEDSDKFILEIFKHTNLHIFIDIKCQKNIRPKISGNNNKTTPIIINNTNGESLQMQSTAHLESFLSCNRKQMQFQKVSTYRFEYVKVKDEE